MRKGRVSAGLPNPKKREAEEESKDDVDDKSSSPPTSQQPSSGAAAAGTTFQRLFLSRKRRRTADGGEQNGEKEVAAADDGDAGPAKQPEEGQPRPMAGDFMSAQPGGDDDGHSPDEDTAEDNRAPPPASGFGGFTTAGGRKLEVSKEALHRASRLLNDNDDDDNETTAAAAGSPPDTARDEAMDLEAEQQQEPFVGFRSGRGKAVVVSEASLAKARHLVMDRDDGNDAAEAGPLSPEDSAPPAFVGFTTGSGRRLEPPKASVEQAMKRFLSDDGVGDGTYEESLAGQHATTSGEAPPEAFVGFTTGSGRRLRPAAENVKRAMDRLLADDDDGDDDSHANGNHPNRAPPAFAGFTTGSGKRLAPPKASVEQAMKRFLDDDGDGDGSSGVNAGAPTSAFVGFTTGSGRRLEPPKASVEQAMKRLLNDDDDDDGEGNGNAAQQSPGRRGEKAGAVTLDDYDALNGPPPPESFGGAGGAAFGGFKTVSGKAINVSAAALARSRQLLADADEEGGNAQRAGKRGEKDGDGEYEPLNEPPPPSESFGGAAFGGFKTVSGKAINVSAAALARSRQLLADADADADADGEGDSAQPAGKRPRFDQDGDGDFDAINGPPPPESFGGAGGAAFGGFKTVSGKAVNVSAAALARSRQLLAEVDDDVEGGNAQSAGKRPPRENAGDDDYDALNGPPPPESFGGAGGAAFGGFKTVSGKAVNVSAAALARSRKLLADAEADVDANRDPSALAPSSPPRANASSHPDEEDEDDDADMLLELSSCADDESAPAPAARAAVAPSRAPRPAPSPLRPATATPLGPPAARSTPSSHLVPSPKPTGRSEFAYPPTPVRATPPRPTSTTAFTTSATTTTTTTTATSRAATDPPRVVVTTPRAPAAASSAGTTGQLARRGPLGGNATGDRRGGAGGAGAPPAKQYAYGCSPYKPPRAHTPARPSRRQAALAATAAPVPEAAPLPPWRYSLPEVSEKLTLKQLAANEPHDLPAPPLSEEVLRMDSDRARHYQFTCEQVFEDMRAHPAAFVLFFSPQAMAALNNPHGVGAAEMHAVLLACGANPKIISPEWTSNHYRWIVWKLAGMERRFPHQLANRHLLPHTVLHQLLYRYEREVNKAKRSALKIILERDESAGRSMILCVAAIRSYGGDAPPPPPATSSTTEGGAAAAGAGGGEGAGGGVIEVTDGWYSINAILDEALTQHMALGKIYPGLKLRVIGARLNGNDNAMSPLEATESTTLLLQVNAVRRALWHAKLGIQRKPVFPVSLRSVRPEGGLVPCVDVVVERRYPLLFLEKKLDGSFITRTSAQEEHARRLFEAKRNRLVEAKKAELEKEASAQASAVTKTKPRTRSPVSKAALAECYDGETLLGWMEGASDPYEFQQLLNPRQQAIVQHHMERSRLDKDEEFGRQLEDFIAEHPDATRTVTPFVRVRLRDCPVVVAGHQRPPRSSSSSSGSGGKSDECVLTIWRPNEEEVAEIFEEGARLRIYFLNPRPPKPAGPSDDGAAMTGGWTAKPRTLELSTTLKTRYARREGPSGVYRARQVQGLEHLHAPQQQQQQQQQRGFGEASREIDVVGVVVGVHGPHECSYKSGRPYLLTQVFLTDASGELLSVELREHPDVAVSRFPFKEAPATPTVVCLSSLAYRSYDANFGVHHASAEEATDVLLAPKGRSSPFAPAYRQLVAWAEQSREEVDAARQRVEALLTGQLVPRSSSTRPGVPVRASLVGALLPFSAVACLPRAGQPSGEWDICLWPASATPPPARFPPRPTTSSADNMDEDHHHHQQQQQQADVALYVLLDDGLARHRLALALPDIVAALDLLRPAHDHHHHLVPVERWLWRCLSSPAPAGPDPSQQQQLRDLLLADLFGGVRFPDDAGAEALSLPSPTALVGEALALALLHSTRPGAAEGTAPALPVPLPGSASPQTPPDGEAPSRPLLLACEEWDGFVAALSASLSTAYDDLEWVCHQVDGEDGTQTGWWHVQSVRRRTGPPSV